MKPFKFIIAIFGLLLLLVCANTQGNPSMRASQEMSFVTDVSPPPAQMIAIQPEFGQSLQVERGVSVPLMFSIQQQPEAVASVKSSGQTLCNINDRQENLRAWQHKPNVFSVTPAPSNPDIGNSQYLIYATDLGDRYVPQAYLNTCSDNKNYIIGSTYLMRCSYIRAREKI